MRVFTSFDQLSEAVGEDLGRTDWLEVTQERVDAFADATGDHQWIHVDVEKAKDGPFKGTIAHGYLTLSLIPYFNPQLFRLDTPGAKLNYGVNKVRFPNPVKVGLPHPGHGRDRRRERRTRRQAAGDPLLHRDRGGEQARLRGRDRRPPAGLTDTSQWTGLGWSGPQPGSKEKRHAPG